MKTMDNRDFKDMVVDHFEHTGKTGWGKREIVRKIKDLWITYLEETIANAEKDVCKCDEIEIIRTHEGHVCAGCGKLRN